MGYRGNEDWRDMSDHVVHFTKPADDPIGIYARKPTAYEPWIKIIGGRSLKPGIKPLGAARRILEVEHLHRVVCFSEIPLDMLDRLIERRSLYGIGFSKAFVVSKGGAPLWYLDKDGEQAATVRAWIDHRVAAGVDPEDPIWRLTPFIDNPGSYGNRAYRFEWEREWRVIGEMAFHQSDVAFLFLPEADHEIARRFFADAQVENTGPAYFCPYIDPRWAMDRIQHALKDVPALLTSSVEPTPWWA